MRNLGIFIAITVFFFNGGLMAHTLYLRDGRVIEGQIIEQSRTEVKIITGGKVVIFQKTDIDKVDFNTVKKPVVKQPETKKEERHINRWTVAGRSALIPGWGHYDVDEKWTGIGYFALTTAFALNAMQARNAAVAAQSHYEAQTAVTFLAITGSNPLGDATSSLVLSAIISAGNFNGYQAKVETYNQSLRLLAIAYGGQVIHAWFTGRRLETSQGAYFMPFADNNGKPAVNLGYQFGF